MHKTSRAFGRRVRAAAGVACWGAFVVLLGECINASAAFTTAATVGTSGTATATNTPASGLPPAATTTQGSLEYSTVDPSGISTLTPSTPQTVTNDPIGVTTPTRIPGLTITAEASGTTTLSETSTSHFDINTPSTSQETTLPGTITPTPTTVMPTPTHTAMSEHNPTTSTPEPSPTPLITFTSTLEPPSTSSTTPLPTPTPQPPSFPSLTPPSTTMPTSMVSQSPTFTSTPSLEITPTPTLTPRLTSAATLTPSSTPATMPTSTLTLTLASTPTPTPMRTPTPTATTSPIITPTIVPVSTPTGTHTHTAISTPATSPAPMPTQAPTPMQTPKPTTTHTLTSVPSQSTPQQIPTQLPTFTPPAASTSTLTVAPGDVSQTTPTLTPLSTPMPTPSPTNTLTQEPSHNPIQLTASFILSNLDISDIGEEGRNGIRASIAELFNTGFAILLGTSTSLFTSSDVRLVRLQPGSVQVEFALAFPEPSAVINSTELSSADLGETAVAAWDNLQSADNAVLEEVFARNGLTNVGTVTLFGRPTITQLDGQQNSPAPPLDQPEGGSASSWWNPSQPLMMAIIATGVLILLVLLIVLVVWLQHCRKRSKIKPAQQERSDKGDAEHGLLLEKGDHPNTPSGDQRSNPQLPSEPPPSFNPPAPNVRLKTPSTAASNTRFSDPRLPSQEPYARLVLISSRIPGALKIGAAALSSCAVGVYDWKHYTLQELLGEIRSMLGGSRVASIALLAPAGKPGAVGLLEGYQTTADKLLKKAELAQFWKCLAGHVSSKGQSSEASGIIHLLNCRVTEAPDKGADLLTALGQITKLSLAASDHPGQYFPLSQSSPTEDGKAYMTATGGTAMDLYFDADILLDAFASVPVAMAAPTPTQRAGSLAPLRNNPHFQSVDDPSARSPPLLQPPPPTDKSLSAYAETIAKLEDDTSKASSLAVKHSVDGDGHLSSGAIVDFLQDMHPGIDDPAFMALLVDLKRGNSYDLQHVIEELHLVDCVYGEIQIGTDEASVLERLNEYLSSNHDVIQQVFHQVDQNGSGQLDMHELCQLVGMIPGLDVAEVRYILLHLVCKGYLKTNGKLSLPELCKATQQ